MRCIFVPPVLVPTMKFSLVKQMLAQLWAIHAAGYEDAGMNKSLSMKNHLAFLENPAIPLLGRYASEIPLQPRTQKALFPMA